MQHIIINFSHHAVLYISRIYLSYNWHLYHLTPFASTLHTTPQAAANLASVPMSLVLCFPFFFRIPISKIIRWLSFPLWLISLSIMPQGPFLSHPYWGNWDFERLSGLCKDIAGTQRLRDSGGLTSEASVSATVLPPAVSPQPASEMLCWKVNWTQRWKARLDTLILPALILALSLFSWMTFGKLRYLFFLLAYQEKSCLLVSVYTMRLFWKLIDILYIKYCIQGLAYNKY